MTYNALRPTLRPSGIRGQIVSSLTTLTVDIKNGIENRKVARVESSGTIFAMIST